eukprot:m.47139 g.47139  ORF g.47139 m.47139 type:complete len:101 (+) comp47516_c0_seq6:219-521(+)
MYNCELFVRLFRLACGFLPPTKLQQYALYVAARAGRAEMLAHLLGERHFRTKRVLNKLDERVSISIDSLLRSVHDSCISLIRSSTRTTKRLSRLRSNREI